jgi:hypothetical protein
MSLCDKLGHKAVDCLELCTICVKTGYNNLIRSGPQWKDHPDYIMAYKVLPDFDDLKSIDHPHVSIIFLSKIMKHIEKEKKRAKVRAKEQAERITKKVNLIRAYMAQMNSGVTRITSQDPRDIIEFDEEWFENRCKKNKGY